MQDNIEGFQFLYDLMLLLFQSQFFWQNLMFIFWFWMSTDG